jgi:anti-sigma B factor antagonist
MANGRSQAPGGRGAAAARATAGPAAAGDAMPVAVPDPADSPDDLIRLSCRVSADGLAQVSIRGELDLASADRTVRFVTEVIDRHEGTISADLSGLTFCDACGLGALIRIAAHAERAGRALELAKPSRAVTRIMRITGVDERLLVPALAGRLT